MTKNDPATELARELRRRREALGLTQDQVAERAGLTPNYIGSIELGKRDPSLSTLMAIAKALDMRPAELFGAVPELSTTAVELGRLFEDAPPDVQTSILKILRLFTRKKRR